MGKKDRVINSCLGQLIQQEGFFHNCHDAASLTVPPHTYSPNRKTISKGLGQALTRPQAGSRSPSPKPLSPRIADAGLALGCLVLKWLGAT